ncbi:MAG: stage II sporulation protein D [Firmicutes bacterium]|nr:stage II sporulation protein D [Bacillota bacterium]
MGFKKILKVILIVLLFFVGIPLAAVLLEGDYRNELVPDGLKGVSFADKVETPETIDVWRCDQEKTVKVNFEEYVACVVASEMPATFEEEALKAQSVAARTFAMAKIKTESPVCDSTHCQVYKTEKELIECHPKGWENESWEKVKKACRATEGELLYYDGELVLHPLFFSSSGGQTENSEDVFVSAVPYLISVSSPYEEKATHKDEEKSFTLKEFAAAVRKSFPDKEFGTISTDRIKILSRTAGGRVEKMQVGDVTMKGTEVRSALGLSSTLFTISFKEGSGWNGLSPSNMKIVFVSSGSGHGVGMSQYGADGMAREGADYKEILKHYYSGTEIY